MTPETLVSGATFAASVILSIAFLLTVVRVVLGPTLPDRVIALDMLVGIAIGFLGVIAIRTGFDLYVDIAIALGLVGFLATVAFARFILSRRPQAGQHGKQVLDGTDQMPAGKPAHRSKQLKRSGRGKRS